MKPKIRFKGFEGEWKTSAIGEIAPLSGGYAFQSNHFSSVGIPIVRISNILETGIVGGDFAKYATFDGDADFRLYDGDAVIAMSGATTGKVAVVHTQGFLYQNQRVGKFTKTDKVNYDFLTTVVKSHKFRADLSCLLTSSAQPNASSRDIDSITQSIPFDKDEQKAIGKYFTSLDSQISASTSRLASLKQMKAASLQAMFPQEGETVPKIRFKGFEGEWKKVKFKDFGHVAMCKRIFKNQTTSEGDVPFYKIGTFGSEPDSYISQSLFEEYKKKYSFPNKGDILISAAGTIGRTVEYNGENCYYQDSNIVWFDHNNNITNGFLKQLYSIVKWSSLEGATIKRLYNSNILETTFYIPNINEQQAIASYFTSLDRQISLQSQRLEKLKQIKSACLDKMFV